MKTLHAHMDYVTAVHFNRDASLIVSCALDGLMRVSLLWRSDHSSLMNTLHSAEFGTQVMASASRRWQRVMTPSGL